MTIVKSALEEMLTKIDCPEIVLYREYHIGDVLSNSKTGKDYVEEQLLQEIREKLKGGNSIPHGPIDAVKEAIVNGLHHGNQEDRQKALRITLYQGNDKWLVRIMDEGQGFDYEQVERTGKHQFFGGGFRRYKSLGFEVSFEEGGKTVNILASN